jgi:hypothetical protein
MKRLLLVCAATVFFSGSALAQSVSVPNCHGTHGNEKSMCRVNQIVADSFNNTHGNEPKAMKICALTLKNLLPSTGTDQDLELCTYVSTKMNLPWVPVH